MFSANMDTVPNAVGCRPRLDKERNRIVNEAEGRALGDTTTLADAGVVEEIKRRAAAGGPGEE